MLTIDAVKNYIRVDGTEDDDMIYSLMDAAESYLDGAIDNFSQKYIERDENWKAKADLAKKLLIADWYENRNAVERPVSPAIRLILTQLQL